MSTLTGPRHDYLSETTVVAEPVITQDGVTLPDASEPETTRPSGWLAALRIATGFVFLWAFFDKLFGLGYSTPSARAWLNGGAPAEGFLANVNVGPFASVFNDMAGHAWVDWLFMLGLLGVGVAVTLGVGLRIAAVSGTTMMLLMWVAAWPLAQTNALGEPTGSSNPLVDYHVLYALALIVVAVTQAGHRFGLGRAWERLPFVQRNRAILQ